MASVFLMTDSLNTGGSERQFSALVRALDPGLFQLHLGCLRREGPFLREIGEIREFALGGSFFTCKAQRARFTLGGHLRSQKILIAQSFDFYTNLMLIPTARLAGVPIVIGSHRQLGDLLTQLQSRAQAAVFRLCDRVICNSRAAAERLLRFGLAESKLAVISNGLPEEAFAEAPPALERRPGVLRIGLIARMNDPVKNHAGFLRAAARLVSRFPTIEFLLVGDGPLRPNLEKIARNLGLERQVRFLGDRRDISAILGSIDISVSFSFSESQSNVVLESMAAGVPVIASRVGGNIEIIQDRKTGILVESGDEGALAHALETLVKHPHLRAEYGKCGKRLAQENFRLDRIAHRYEELYRSLLEQKGTKIWQTR